jgi:uncharacterized protein (DUF58 family)
VTAAERTARSRWRAAGSGSGPSQPPSASPAALAAKAATLQRLELDVTRRLDGLLSGDYLAFAHGAGSEPAGARPYSPGDDARRIDWNLSARASVAHIRSTEADRELETWVVADRSASLDFGTALREKREVALAAVAAFGFLNLRAGNRFGMIVAGGDRLAQVPALSGRPGLLAALSALYDTPRRTTPPGEGADLNGALLRLERTQPRRGRVVVVSDYLDRSEWAAALRRLSLRHQVIAVHITDRREMELPPVGMLAVVDTESGQLLHVQTNSATLRDRYAAAAAGRQKRILDAIAGAGAEHLSLSTDRDWLGDIARFVGRRRRERIRSVPRPALAALRIPVATSDPQSGGVA